ncbi:major facilitator superfamily domain-containing protein [Leucosporidium creatinivorum]|uniref:Major facilitator superfamily domain-containing protein n=1 Tax=Leucosporidium creatinivorum TaxID=106004 RepID=A0A1Y2FYP8_9BASI|nr:major facilitator superfamily domain-containing protein [Leucosporidium creatinivorum]
MASKQQEEGLKSASDSDVALLKSPQQLIDEEERRWYQWFSKTDTPAERRLIVKLDLLIVLFSVACYWVKYLDQTNISNAYVSGMSKELGFHGNELVQFQTVYIVGAAVMQLPFIWIFVKVPMNVVVPSLDILWGIVTLLQFRTTSYGEMIAYRFLVGCFEAAFFPAVHWVLGSWYRKDEIARRGGIFYLGLNLGTLTSGLLQSATLRGLDGHLGLAAWRWMFIVNAIITIPLGILGFFVWPGTPDKCHSFFLSKEEVELAKARLLRVGHTSAVHSFTFADFKAVLRGWKVWVLSFWDVLFWNTGPNGAAYLLWLKSIYPTNLPKVNELSVTAPAIGIAYVLGVNFASDLIRSPRISISFCNTALLIGILILASGTGNHAARFVGYNLLPFSYSQSSSLYGWSNAILRRDPKERVIVLIVMNTLAQASTAFIGLLTYPTAPRFKKGFIFSAVITFSQICFTQVVAWFATREEHRNAELDRLASAQSERSSTSSLKDEGLESPRVTDGLPVVERRD